MISNKLKLFAIQTYVDKRKQIKITVRNIFIVGEVVLQIANMQSQ